MKLIHVTDTHLVEPGLRLYGLDPRARLDAAIADINRHHADAALVVVTGDLTHWGEPAAYRHFEAALRPLRIPHVALLGNHDRRATALAALAALPRDDRGFAQGVRDIGVWRLIFLDTLNEASHAGQLCETRLAWLGRVLAEASPGRQILLFMHHPPLEVGVTPMDVIALADRKRFADVIAPYRGNIRHLFFGHVHRPISGCWQGIPFSTVSGTNHQEWLDFAPGAQGLASHEPPAYAIVLLAPDQIVVHLHNYLDQSARLPFGKPGVDGRLYALGPSGT